MPYRPYRNDALGPAILWGGLATGACYLGWAAIWTIAQGWAEPVPLILFAGFIGWFVGTLAVTLGMVLIGLPVSALFRWLDCEDAAAYTLAGAIAGFLVPCLPVLIAGKGTIGESPLFFALPGLVAGATAGFVWGRWRERLALEENADHGPLPPARDRGERWLR